MSWTDKALKRAKAEKMAMEIMNSKKYKDAKKYDMEQAAMKAYCRFILVGCDFLQMKHNYKKNGIRHFLQYATDVMKYTLEDENYFEDMNNVMIDECGIDVMAALGVMIKKDGGEDGES